MTSNVAYNSDDPLQQLFLQALAQGETGGSSYAFSEGTGGSNLSGDPTDQYGFPQWTGEGNSHAAGAYQFQPGTWDAIAAEYGLNFSNPADQSAGAWDLAEQTYSQQTGGQSLEVALQSGNYSSVQSALAGVWPSVTGNQAAPQGLAGTLSASSGPAASATAAATTANNASGATTSSSTQASSGGVIGEIQSFFIRGGLIIIGGIVIALALYALLVNQGYAPSPKRLAQKVI